MMDVALARPAHDPPGPAGVEHAFWQTLGGAFLPPTRQEMAQAFMALLPDDLEEFSRALALDASDLTDALRQRIAALPDPMALRIDYADCFLPPSGAATLNLARYVDSGVAGPCVDALDLVYQAHGLAPGEGLRDCADHAARQFECLAWLCSRADGSAGEFARLCLVGALPRLAAQLAAVAPASPYVPLVELADRAVRRYGTSVTTQHPARPNRRHDLTAGVWRHCSGCGKPYAREKEICIMTAALQRAGLPAEHLAQCPDCRDRAQGFFRRAIA